MHEYTQQAIERLDKELKSGSFDRYGNIMKQGVHDALAEFCRQDGEFAQAVVQGGSFADCMKAVAKNCGNGISDIEAYRRAAQFYFDGANVEFEMHIYLCEADKPEKGGIVLNLDDFFS